MFESLGFSVNVPEAMKSVDMFRLLIQEYSEQPIVNANEKIEEYLLVSF